MTGGAAATVATDAVEPLTIAIKMAALRGSRYRPYQFWGDFHFADALKDALVRLGHQVAIDPTWDWYAPPRDEPDDVVIVLRGLFAYDPQPGAINIMWNINHADRIPYEEYERYDLIYVASASYASLLATFVDSPIRAMLQATEPARFHPARDEPGKEPSHDILFVGNSRREYRDIVRWAVEEGLEPAIYGTGWERFVPPRLVRGNYIDNKRLTEAYGSAATVLCDHFASMREFGFVSNRAYDVVASGGRLVCDHIPSIARLFGDSVRTVRDRTALKAATEATRPTACSREATELAAKEVHRLHTLDHRATAMVSDIACIRRGDRAGLRDGRSGSTLRGVASLALPRVHVTARHEGSVPDDLAFIRLICPLSGDLVGVDLSVGKAGESWPDGTQVWVVQSGAIARSYVSRDLVARARADNIRLVLDVDSDRLAEADEALLASADQVWLANPALETSALFAGRPTRIVPGVADLRLWKSYAPAAERTKAGGPCHLLLIDRPPGSVRLEPVLAALDRLAAVGPAAFDLFVIGSRTEFAPRPWLRAVDVPALAAAYPAFVRWLRNLGPFDAALIPPADDLSSMDARILEARALGLSAIACTGVGGAGSPPPAIGRTGDEWIATLESILRDMNIGARQIADDAGARATAGEFPEPGASIAPLIAQLVG